MARDISDENRNVFNFEDMICRALKFEKERGRPPQIVYVDDRREEYVNWSRFQEMFHRYYDFMTKNHRIPRFIMINPQAPPKPSEDSRGCCDTGFYKQDYQDTGYSCGASSLKMALSAYHIFVTEQEIMRIAGTTSAGTTHDGMIRAANHYGLKAWFRNFIDTGWAKICDHIKKNGEIIFHIMTHKLQDDCRGNTVWRGAYGHYIYLIKVCPDEKIVWVADPTKGVRCHTYSQMEAAMAAVTWAPSVLFLQKPERVEEPLITAKAEAGPNNVEGEQGITYKAFKEYLKAFNLSAEKEAVLEEMFISGRLSARAVDELFGEPFPDFVEVDGEVFVDPELVIARAEAYKEV